MTSRVAMWALAACAMGIGMAVGCAGEPSTTRLGAEDLVAFSEEAAQSLASGDAISGRGPRDAPWVIAMRLPRNLSHDVISEGERWFVMERLKDSLAMSRLARERGLVFVIDRERAASAGDVEGGDPAGFPNRRPTHVLEGEFRSIERRSGEHRTDAYAFVLSLRDLADGAVVWSDSFVIKRGAHGRAWD